MTKLSDSLLSPRNFEPLISDCVVIVENEVRQKNIAIRGVFKLANRAVPQLTERALRRLLPDFAVALDPVYDEFKNSDKALFAEFAREHETRIADTLLQVTDHKVQQVNNKAIRSGYSKLRGRAQREVAQALPHIADAVARYHPPESQTH